LLLPAKDTCKEGKRDRLEIISLPRKSGSSLLLLLPVHCIVVFCRRKDKKRNNVMLNITQYQHNGTNYIVVWEIKSYNIVSLTEGHIAISLYIHTKKK
jgi:hypothetical protein